MTKKINLKITKNNQKTGTEREREKIETIIIKNFLMIQKTKKNKIIKMQIMISMTIKIKKNIINKI